MSKRILFLLAAAALVISGWYIRSTNAAAARAKAATITDQDRRGADTKDALTDLKTYAATHLGATITVTLSGSYERAQAQATAPATTNAQVYAAAQAACAGKSNAVTQARCNQDYVSKHLVPTGSPAPAPKLADYQKTYKSPWWTPDLAGALFLGAAAALLAAVFIRRRGY